MISQQLIPETKQISLDAAAQPEESIVLGAKILRIAVALDNLRMKGLSDEDAIAKLHDRRDEFGIELVEALVGIKPGTAKNELRKVSPSKF